MDAALRLRIVRAVEGALAGGPMVAVATVVTGGEAGLLTPGEKLLVHADGACEGSLGSAAADAAVLPIVREMFTARPRMDALTLYVAAAGEAVERPSLAARGDAEVMVQLHSAPARLVVVGGGHVGLAVATIGEIAGFEVTVIDDRPEFASRERFPMAEHVLVDAPGPALDAVAVDASTAIVLVSRGHRLDEEALRHSVGRGAGYVGMIGSRRRTSTILRHLEEEGFDRAALDAVATPIGLDIGAETPEEIAVAILAEVIMLRRGGTGGRMRGREAGL